MGFYKLILRIGRMIFRDFLFKIPKKYLVVIIMFLAIMFLKSNVFAYSNYDYIEVDDPVIDNVYYKYCQLNQAFDTGVPAPYYIDSTDFRNNYQFTLKCSFVQSGSWGYVFNNGELNSPDNFGLWYRNPTTEVLFGYFGASNSLSSYSFGTDYEFNIFMYPVGGGTNPSYVVYQGDNLHSQGTMTMGTSQVNTSKNQTILLGVDNPIINFENFKIYTHNQLSQDVLQVNLYPCKYRDTSSGSIVYLPGFYDVVSGNFIYFSNMILNDNDILSTPPEEVVPVEPTPTPTPSGSIDYTNNFNEINNSINATNDLISNSTISNNVIQQPNVPTDSSGVESGVNNIFTAIMYAFKNIDTNQNIVFTIPNTNKNITINGNYTRDMLHNNGGDWVITIISAFWWYVISAFIVKDILNIVDKIQEGKLDKVESNNIKGDML